jgi:subtilisin family serine protease
MEQMTMNVAGCSRVRTTPLSWLSMRLKSTTHQQSLGAALGAILVLLTWSTAASAGSLHVFLPFLWWLHRLEAPAAWRQIGAGPQIVVAVIDSGIDVTHPDLRHRILRDGAGRPLGYNLADPRRSVTDPMDVDGHGTHIAGIIAALTEGIADRVRLLPLKVTDAQGRPSLYAVTEALELARLMRADIVNVSLATDFPAYELERAIQAASEAGILIVAGAGQAFRGDPRPRNLDDTEGGVFPAAYSLRHPILSVTASDESDDLPWWTNYGPRAVQVAAPGAYIWSTLPGAGYGGRSGSSMAAAVVSGVAALAKARHPQLRGMPLREWLLESTRPLRQGARALVSSGGRVSALQAVAPLH